MEIVPDFTMYLHFLFMHNHMSLHSAFVNEAACYSFGSTYPIYLAEGDVA